MAYFSRLTAPLLLKASKTAIVVGSTRLLINQFDALFYDAPFRFVPALLTYCVPFVVFLYGNLSKDR
ncbi:MAG: dihydrolipoamide dehydrogenase [Cellvibrionaceae bacterium]|nr:dihydrolipoamide dehydrogenase [Cellvibrionaceae bacterium]